METEITDFFNKVEIEEIDFLCTSSGSSVNPNDYNLSVLQPNQNLHAALDRINAQATWTRYLPNNL